MNMLFYCIAVLWYVIVDNFLPMYSVNPITYDVMYCHTCILFLPFLTCLPFPILPVSPTLPILLFLVLPTTLIGSMLLHGFSSLFFSVSRSFYLS